jgi:serine/threonine protein kinase
MKMTERAVAFPQSSLPVILSWDDVDTGCLLGEGAFASVYRVVRSSLLPEDDGESQSDDLMTEATFLGESFGDLTALTQAHERSETHRLVLKCTKPPSSDDTHERALVAAQGLVSEASILASLPRHPNIIRLIGISSHILGREPGSGFLVLERVTDTLDKVLKTCNHQSGSSSRGEFFSLSSFFRRRRTQGMTKCAQQLRVRIVLGVAEAMQFLHEHGILHRDLKPGNVGLGYDGEVRLLDFGSSRKKEGRRLTQAVGTMRYMAPEVALSQDYGFPADVHSFAILLWEVLTLHKPFDELSRTREELRHIIHVQQKRPSLRAVASPALRRLLQASWNTDPKLRPSFTHVVGQLKMESPRKRKSK